MTEQMEHGGPVASPEERVRAFISHWYAQWSVAQREMGNRVDFDRWGDMVSQVDQVHFVPGCHSDSRGSFSSRADYDPEHERVVESDARGDAASVYTETLNQQLGSTSYHVYDLRRGADGVRDLRRRDLRGGRELRCLYGHGCRGTRHHRAHDARLPRPAPW